MRDYKEEEKNRVDKNISFRVYEDSKYIKVSKTKKSKTLITIHPYLKEEYKKICGNLSQDIEDYLKAQIEIQKGKKIIFKS